MFSVDRTNGNWSSPWGRPVVLMAGLLLRGTQSLLRARRAALGFLNGLARRLAPAALSQSDEVAMTGHAHRRLKPPAVQNSIVESFLRDAPVGVWRSARFSRQRH
ncbi:unnamed protein product [Nesidiocoris tenuis]|uniref:Uncharacterized protein n=1 Tax=Nesidiocoris tenuis TaxID=355587 RepID=A0A6H5GIF6_9HEMI|nr:unnamed protein product [Nesidiocoris tenuis]